MNLGKNPSSLLGEGCTNLPLEPDAVERGELTLCGDYVASENG